MPLAYMNAYPPTISCRVASLTCRSRCSDGAATFTAQMSKPAMNMAMSTTGSISQRRGSGSEDDAEGTAARTTARELSAREIAFANEYSLKFEVRRSSMTVEQYYIYRT